MVDIKGLDKARVLKALYDHSHVQGLGFMHAAEEGAVTVESCAKLLEKYTQYDYLHGRVLKVDLSGDEFDERLYDRDCGEGAAQRAVDSIRAEQEGGKNTAGNADGEKKEPSLEEQAEMTKEAIHKIMDILNELPPTCHVVASMTLKNGAVRVGIQYDRDADDGRAVCAAAVQDHGKSVRLADRHGTARAVRIKENALRKPPTACAGRRPGGRQSSTQHIVPRSGGICKRESTRAGAFRACMG